MYSIYKHIVKRGKNTDLAAATKTPFATIKNSDITIATLGNWKKPIRFTRQQLAGFTRNYATRLGSGDFGVVYKGEFPNGIAVAVKVLNGDFDYKSLEQRFMAEMGTIGRTFHKNLVRIYGFCLDSIVRALVYEYMDNGSLDTYLFKETHAIAWEKLHEIAIGAARGLTYLHEECEQRIIHYDIKPENILLDLNFTPKVADFGLKKLSNKWDHVSSTTTMKGNFGYMAPEMWMGLTVTYTCDVYSFGMLLFELVRRKRNINVRLKEDERWFPKWVWERYENEDVEKVMVKSRIEDEHKAAAERMLMVALWCVQYQPERRPPMSKVVKMLEGEMEIMPPLNPFQHMQSSSAPSLDFSDDMSSSSAGVSGKSNPMKHGNAILADGENATLENFINEIAREKPIRFTSQELDGFTRNYATRLGSGGFGVVYKGEFPNGIAVAVKVLNGDLDYKSVEQQFMAEMGTIGRTFHANIVRIYGFCFDSIVTALVYEYMDNGSLDTYLFKETHAIAWEKLHEIAIGTARGLTYLHEECEQRIIHADIKPANILLDLNFSPRVGDFGLAKLSNRENTHVSMAVGRGTPGYTAPEIWMQAQVTYKCDVYSFGMLLFELVGRRRNYIERSEEDERWFPKWVWERYEKGEVEKVMVRSRIEDEHKGAAERMLMVAFWCVQTQPKRRPLMSKVIKMLEGDVEIMPPSNPWPHLFSSEMTTVDEFIIGAPVDFNED